jgi:hypothetical protein
MVPDENHHLMLRKKMDGVTTLITRMSHDNEDIRGARAGLMARQCALHGGEFWELVECSLTQQGWDKLIRERCADGHNPFIGR